MHIRKRNTFFFCFPFLFVLFLTQPNFAIAQNKKKGIKTEQLKNAMYKITSKVKLPHFNIPIHFKKIKKDSSILVKDTIVKITKPIINRSAVPLPVGYVDFDDNIRDLQLLGKIAPDNSLTIRPFILIKGLTYDSLLQLIDTSVHYKGTLVHKKNFDVQLLPVNFLQKYNSNHPYGWDDGALSFSKGYQMSVSTGVYVHWYNLHLTLRPEYFKTASDPYETSGSWGQVTPSISKVWLGQSSLRLDLGKFSAKVSTENLWLGPGIYSSLLMSNNAQGFAHASFGTNRPLKSFLGRFEFQIFGATLTHNSTQDFENGNAGLKTRGVSSNTRYINMLSVSYSPVFMKNVYFGFNRVFHQYSIIGKSDNFMRDYLPVTNGLFRNTYQDNALAIDQLISGYTRWVFPNNHAEVYFEYGWNDGASNSRDLNLDLSHSSASIFGFKKLQYLNNKTYLSIQGEATRMSQTPSYIQRNAGNWYEHGQISEGYTNENQILGAGSGFGNNVQTILASVNKGFSSVGIKFQHVAQNPRRLATDYANLNLIPISSDWHDYGYGIITKYKYKKVLFNLETQWVNSQNYLWKEGHNVGNFYCFFNTIYLW